MNTPTCRRPLRLTRRGRIVLGACLLTAAVVAIPAAALGVNGADILVLVAVIVAVLIAATLD